MFLQSELELLKEIITYYLDTFTEEEKEECAEFLVAVEKIENKIKKMLDK